MNRSIHEIQGKSASSWGENLEYWPRTSESEIHKHGLCLQYSLEDYSRKINVENTSKSGGFLI